MSATTSVQVSTVPATVRRDEAFASSPTACDLLVRAGLRGAPRAAVMPALRAWWGLLGDVSVEDRSSLCADLRGRVRAGETTARAWLAVALGEVDAALVKGAVHGYLGASPVSLERRAATLHEVTDWLRRGLVLNGSAVFEALLELGDEATLEILARVRSTLHVEDARRLCDAWAGAESDAVATFVQEWRALLA